MSGHRVELRVSFSVGDEDPLRSAEVVIRRIRWAGRSAEDFQVVPVTVDGNGWFEKWPNNREGE